MDPSTTSPDTPPLPFSFFEPDEKTNSIRKQQKDSFESERIFRDLPKVLIFKRLQGEGTRKD